MITWTITKLSRDASTNGVMTAHWRALLTEEGYTAGTQGICTLTPNPDAADFIPYADLDEATVLSWIHANGVDKADVEAGLAVSMIATKNPPVLTGVPWS